MRQFLILSHGHFATGILDSLTMLMGELSNTVAIPAYVDNETDIQEEIHQILNKLQSNDELIIFTDIWGGSINNNAMLCLNDSRVHLITGVNLAIIAEIINGDSTVPIAKIIEDAIPLGREALRYCNIENTKIEDEDF